MEIMHTIFYDTVQFTVQSPQGLKQCCIVDKKIKFILMSLLKQNEKMNPCVYE